ncbi:hypothetical protein GYA49_03740 [Candidatus Beckwithbacteria bacterium]|nr:hypothetical protein [Candidatus Beckwithbacteria bacterium]
MSMNKQDINQLISNVIGVDVAEVSADAHFFEDYNCEPTDMIELKLQLEDALKSKIDQDEFDRLETVADLYELIEEYTDDFID